MKKKLVMLFTTIPIFFLALHAWAAPIQGIVVENILMDPDAIYVKIDRTISDCEINKGGILYNIKFLLTPNETDETPAGQLDVVQQSILAVLQAAQQTRRPVDIEFGSACSHSDQLPYIVSVTLR